MIRGSIVPVAAMSQANPVPISTPGTRAKGIAVLSMRETVQFNRRLIKKPNRISDLNTSLKLPTAMAIEVSAVRNGAASIPTGRHIPNAEITNGNVIN